MSRPRHPNKTVEGAVRYAESLGWRVQLSRGHGWGRLFCPQTGRLGCIISIWSTPRNAENHARHIRREVDRCPHIVDEGDCAANGEQERIEDDE